VLAAFERQHFDCKEMLVRTDGTRIYVGDRFSVSFQRTLRIPNDGQQYPLPPSLGPFNIHTVEDFAGTVPPKWLHQGAFFLPVYQREALWLGFDGEEWKPNAVKVAVGGVNAVSGTVWEEGLNSEQQDYLVCPDQPWLDGINAGANFVRQFVAAPLGMQHTVEAQITGQEETGGIQLVVYEPKPGRFPDEPPEPSRTQFSYEAAASVEMGLEAGGQIKQKIYPDPYGIDVWDQQNREAVYMYLINSEQYRAICGLEPPSTPVSAETYAEYGLPWFDLYDESMSDVTAPQNLSELKTRRDSDDSARSIDTEKLPVERLHRRKSENES
jgi:hypothetical protein